jgi:hypothetical protein
MVEERLRYRRRYFRKIMHSVQSRVSRHNMKTIEIDSKKIRWDSHQNNIFNYAFSRKLSLNLEGNASNRWFVGEPFDQDSMREILLAPAAFWTPTPKSRINLGYTFGANRIRTKVGNANSHEVHAGYFGSVTRKSSVSLDLSYSHQVPKAFETPKVNAFKMGLGYIWQLTAKTQMLTQIFREYQNSTSNSVPTVALEEGQEEASTKNDVHFINDSFSVSFNSRLHPKLTGVLDFNVSHVRTEAPEQGDVSIENRQFTFPTSLTLNYYMRRYLVFRFRYTFTYRTGDEKLDSYKAHTLMSGVNAVF